MTEQEWLNSDYPLELLGHLRRKRRAVPSHRKFRLFACASVTHTGRFLRDQRLMDAIELTERFADRLADGKEMRAGRRSASEACVEISQRRGDVKQEVAWSEDCAAAVVYMLTKVSRSVEGEHRLSMRVAKEVAYHATEAVKYGEQDAAAAVRAGRQEMAYQCRLLRDIVSNPFRPVTFDPRWRTSEAVALARGIYEDRAFDRLLPLADALMDAGCDDEQVLSHCRGDGPHVRGCWVVDLVLGKE